MDSLTAAFYDVMYQYRIPFSPEGVAANLAAWHENKAPLVELLRRHPNWNEQELAIVFDFSESREIDHDSVDENKFEMMTLAHDAGLSEADLSDFQAALDAATADYATVPDVSRLETIRTRGRIKCAERQKASRIINRLCSKFGLDQYQVERMQGEHGDNPTLTMVKPYNAIFARLADSLNPVQIPKTGILSVHPCDFLEMSSQKNSWHSCHCLADGGWRAGCQSYMGDGVSMIFFTVDNDVRSDFYRAPRLTRQIFCYKDGLLLQSRLYPGNEDHIRKLYRELVQRAISQCLGTPNLWKTKMDLNEIQSFWMTPEESKHYRDYNNGYAALSFLGGVENYGQLLIGSIAHCVGCGRTHTNRSSIRCGECSDTVVCKDCGHTVPFRAARYMDGVFVCNECAAQCGGCNTWIRGDRLHRVTRKGGIVVQLCDQCYTSATGSCEQCGSHDICKLLGGERFCSRTEYFAAAA